MFASGPGPVEQDVNSSPGATVRPSENTSEELLRKTVLIAGAAHELKTPLAVLAGYTKLLLEEQLGPLNEPQHRVLLEMEAGAARLQRCVNDFLAFGALEAGRLAPECKLHAVNDFVREVVQVWTKRFQNAGKTLTFLPGTDLPPAWFDELKIQHVLANLLDNALKFTPDGGEVTITTRPHFREHRTLGTSSPVVHERRHEFSRRDNAIRVDVRDNGPGIPAEFHLQVFEEFHRLPSGRSSEGSGLGLAIAKRLIDAHGGKIWIESGSGPGAIFSFVLPISSGSVTATKGTHECESPDVGSR